VADESGAEQHDHREEVADAVHAERDAGDLAVLAEGDGVAVELRVDVARGVRLAARLDREMVPERVPRQGRTEGPERDAAQQPAAGRRGREASGVGGL
jgi:hypothetical protein